MSADGEVPDVLSATRLSTSFLGKLIEVCFATEDHRRTMTGLTALGIGPWRVYTFDGTTVADRTYAGEPAEWGLKVCFATVGDLAVEIMQPLFGPSIIRDFLDKHGDGVHHLAFDCAGVPWDSRSREFATHGSPAPSRGASWTRTRSPSTTPRTRPRHLRDLRHPRRLRLGPSRRSGIPHLHRS